MTMVKVGRLRICAVCHGLHRGLPACAGRPQTDREWMLDRGVRPSRADEIIAARTRTSAETGHVFPAMAREPGQGSLF